MLGKKTDSVIQAILDDLAKAGCHVNSLEALGEIENPPSIIYKILNDWVGKVPPKYTGRLNQIKSKVYAKNAPVIAQRSMAELLTFYTDHEPSSSNGTFGPLWDIGNEIYSQYSDDFFTDIAALVQNRAYGVDRQMLVLALGKSKRPEAVDVLLSVLDDYGVSGHATEALAKLHSERAREGLTLMLGDDQEWVRTQAQLGLKRLDEAASR
jgi:hypothetical protein